MVDDLRNTGGSEPLTLQKLSLGSYKPQDVPHTQVKDADDLSFFLRTKAYADIMTFLLQLNRSMVPQPATEISSDIKSWPLNQPISPLSTNVEMIASLIQSLKSLMTRAPPLTGPRRFGNAAFRTWYSLVEEAVPGLLKETLPAAVWEHAKGENERRILEKELELYLLGSFGNPRRLDYGTGHELSFLAFLGCIWKLGGFAQGDAGEEERAIVLGIIQPYLELIRKLILTYTMEPAGSHGVWGLDDHSFIPYIFGSAQYSPPTKPGLTLPTEGSLESAPSPKTFAFKEDVETYRSKNIFFSAVGFILDVKTGPFWEHSSILYNISGIEAGWAKINKGMIKMYNVEVLSKVPVVQHFPFGTLFSWEVHPEAGPPTPSSSASAQSHQSAVPVNGATPSSNRIPLASAESGASRQMPRTAVPWASAGISTARPTAGTAAPWATGATNAPLSMSRTAAPWARPSTTAPGSAQTSGRNGASLPQSSATTMPSEYSRDTGRP